MLGLALSGGGARAMAFHLGCLRSLNKLGLLEKVEVISAVSGGAVVAALYAYTDEPFEEFDRILSRLISEGLEKRIFKKLASPKLLAKVAASNLLARPINAVSKKFGKGTPLPRWASRTDALEDALHDVLGDIKLSDKTKVEVVINACDLITQTALRFGSKGSSCWRYGMIDESEDLTVPFAVACSAAYPIFLPAIDRNFTFRRRDGSTHIQRVVITDGGIYDNLGLSCLEPTTDPRFNLHAYPCDYLICCNAGHGLSGGTSVPFNWVSRMTASFETVFRKANDATMKRLHDYKTSGLLQGFILPYLGQQDSALERVPADFVPREAVVGYPTNFSPVSKGKFEVLTRRGAQLTEMLAHRYIPELLATQ